jgi:hypothetical protein
MVLKPIFEADFHAVSYGFRPKLSATDGAERIRVAFSRGAMWVAETDIRDYSARSIISGCWDWSPNAFRIARCSSSCDNGLRRG